VATGIQATGLRKSFGKVEALRGVDLQVERGTILGLLGPNGAGKTTLVRVLATLLRADAGTASVAGHDVAREPGKVRAAMGLCNQMPAVDDNLTGRENLVLTARFYHLPRAEAERRAQDLLARFDLLDAADRTAGTYSGGMRRRLDVAASLIGDPEVLFLDEPTTGLDPRSRLAVWDVIEGLRQEGKTILLTTQYLEEVDRLADAIAVVDHGTIIAQGTANALKARVGGEVVEVTVADPARLAAAAKALADLGAKTDAARLHVLVPAKAGAQSLTDVVRRLDAAKIEASDIALRRPTLDDVFLAITGKTAQEGEANA
jgi:ABC-2 type transport system ATP-binding protein